MKTVMSFDLSTSCIGVVWKKEDASLQAASLCPPRPCPQTELGFCKSKQRIRTPSRTFLSWVYPGEEHVSFSVKKKRDVLVREAKDATLLFWISQHIQELIQQVHPDLVLVEKNEIFNGILTSVLLAKVMGVLHSICATEQIPLREFHVREVRKAYPLLQWVSEFLKGKTSEELKAIPDITKHVIRLHMEEKYQVQFASNDESDACIVFDYYKTHVV